MAAAGARSPLCHDIPSEEVCSDLNNGVWQCNHWGCRTGLAMVTGVAKRLCTAISFPPCRLNLVVAVWDCVLMPGTLLQVTGKCPVSCVLTETDTYCSDISACGLHL